jgi:hypothetical protein
MTKVRVNVKIRAQLQNIFGVPCSIYLATKLGNEMNATLNLCDRYNSRSSVVTPKRSRNFIHTKVHYWSLKSCEPFNICKRVLEGTKIPWKLEYDLDLTNCQT